MSVRTVRRFCLVLYMLIIEKIARSAEVRMIKMSKNGFVLVNHFSENCTLLKVFNYENKIEN